MSYCEDYPCCGHTPSDPCDGGGYISSEDYYKHFSADDYDPYYDVNDY